MRGVPHHLLGVLDPWETATIKDFQDMCIPIIQDIHRREKVPIIVGGTNYYIERIMFLQLDSPDKESSGKHFQSSVVRETESSPPVGTILPNEEIPKSFNKHETLKQIDPDKALLIHPGDTRRVEKALEIALSQVL